MIIINKLNPSYTLNAKVYNLMEVATSEQSALNQKVSIIARTGYGTADLTSYNEVSIQNEMPILKAIIIK